MPTTNPSKSINVIGVPGGTTYAIATGDSYINVFTLNGPVTLVLPKITNNWGDLAAKVYYISDKSSTAANNAITIISQTGETVNFQQSVQINQNGMFALVKLVNNSQWSAKFQYIYGEPATQIAFDNTSTTLSATNVQDAIEEIAAGGGGGGAGSGEIIDLGDRIIGNELMDLGSRI